MVVSDELDELRAGYRAAVFAMGRACPDAPPPPMHVGGGRAPLWLYVPADSRGAVAALDDFELRV